MTGRDDAALIVNDSLMLLYISNLHLLCDEILQLTYTPGEMSL